MYMTDAALVINEVKKAVVGKDLVLVKALLAILAGGHILLEDIPGVGKTTMALAFSKALGLEYNRVQFTPDVLPSDITGYSVYNSATGEMSYRPGAVLCNLFLADELNRATSRTQSALLEAMEEGQVTVDSVSRSIPKPFIVIAAQNPAGAKGTQLLPDSQLDRFMVRLSIGYPEREDELEMLKRRQNGEKEMVKQVTDAAGLIAMRNQVKQIFVKDSVLEYIVRLTGATREHPGILQGASPRGTIALTEMAKALAYVHGRDYVRPADAAEIFETVITHRLIFSPKGAGQEKQIIEEILRDTPMPKYSR